MVLVLGQKGLPSLVVHCLQATSVFSSTSTFRRIRSLPKGRSKLPMEMEYLTAMAKPSKLDSVFLFSSAFLTCLLNRSGKAE